MREREGQRKRVCLVERCTCTSICVHIDTFVRTDSKMKMADSYTDR